MLNITRNSFAIANDANGYVFVDAMWDNDGTPTPLYVARQSMNLFASTHGVQAEAIVAYLRKSGGTINYKINRKGESWVNKKDGSTGIFNRTYAQVTSVSLSPQAVVELGFMVNQLKQQFGIQPTNQVEAEMAVETAID